MDNTRLLDILSALLTQGVLSVLLLAMMGLGTAAIILHRRGKKSVARNLGITSAVLGLMILCLGLALVLPLVPPVDPSVFPSLDFDLLPTPAR